MSIAPPDAAWPMSLGARRRFYRVRNNAYGWAKLAIVAWTLGFLTLQVVHHF